jgi:hypothetical protein
MMLAGESSVKSDAEKLTLPGTLRALLAQSEQL